MKRFVGLAKRVPSTMRLHGGEAHLSPKGYDDMTGDTAELKSTRSSSNDSSPEKTNSNSTYSAKRRSSDVLVIGFLDSLSNLDLESVDLDVLSLLDLETANSDSFNSQKQLDTPEANNTAPATKAETFLDEKLIMRRRLQRSASTGDISVTQRETSKFSTSPMKAPASSKSSTRSKDKATRRRTVSLEEMVPNKSQKASNAEDAGALREKSCAKRPSCFGTMSNCKSTPRIHSVPTSQIGEDKSGRRKKKASSKSKTSQQQDSDSTPRSRRSRRKSFNKAMSWHGETDVLLGDTTGPRPKRSPRRSTRNKGNKRCASKDASPPKTRVGGNGQTDVLDFLISPHYKRGCGSVAGYKSNQSFDDLYLVDTSLPGALKSSKSKKDVLLELLGPRPERPRNTAQHSMKSGCFEGTALPIPVDRDSAQSKERSKSRSWSRRRDLPRNSHARNKKSLSRSRFDGKEKKEVSLVQFGPSLNQSLHGVKSQEQKPSFPATA
jgi:hypothetical protein